MRCVLGTRAHVSCAHTARRYERPELVLQELNGVICVAYGALRPIDLRWDAMQMGRGLAHRLLWDAIRDADAVTPHVDARTEASYVTQTHVSYA